MSDPRPVTAPTHASVTLDLLRRLMWLAKAVACSCMNEAGWTVNNDGERKSWHRRTYECPRCRAIREVQEAVPDVV